MAYYQLHNISRLPMRFTARAQVSSNKQCQKPRGSFDSRKTNNTSSVVWQQIFIDFHDARTIRIYAYDFWNWCILLWRLDEQGERTAYFPAQMFDRSTIGKVLAAALEGS